MPLNAIGINRIIISMIPKFMSPAQTSPKFWTPIFDFFLDISNSYEKQKTLYFFFFQNLFPHILTKPIFSHLSKKPNQLSVTQTKILGVTLGRTLSLNPSHLSQKYSTVGLATITSYLGYNQCLLKQSYFHSCPSPIHSHLIYQRDILKI